MLRLIAVLMTTLSLAWAQTLGGSVDAKAIAAHPAVTAAIQVLDAWIAATAASREQPGLSAGVLYDQELIWSKGYGFADVQKKTLATPATLYRIASISKLFTSTAILQLRDAGKLELDDPVVKHLAWFKIKNLHPQGPVVTIRHLLTHTSGLPREASGVNWTDRHFPSREEMIRTLAGLETVFPAEVQWKYSNLALSLAGEIVAAASGEPWDRYLETHILKPLGMTATRVLPGPGTAGLATGYGRRVPNLAREAQPVVDIQAERPAGNLASSVADLAKFLALQMRDGPAGGAQILKGSTLREMHRIHWLRPDWTSGWGLGFSVRRAGGQVRIGHGGSLPGHRTQIEIAPADKLGVIVLTNADDGNPVRYVDQAFDLLTPATKRAIGPPKPPAADPAWQKYTGTYTWKHSDVEVRILDGELTLISPEDDNPWESRVLLKPVGPHTFRMEAPSTSYAALGELLRFEVDAQGRVTKARTPNSYWLRKAPSGP
ncbi:MAG: serine hydrolase domain-containing protein [Acidobacteriota bacterium]